MKITTFNPQIITQNPDDVVKVFEELGFEKRHDKKDIGEMKVEGIRMKDANGFALDLSVPEVTDPAIREMLSRDLTCIRMNVDNFEEAKDLLLARGFKNIYGDGAAETKSSKSAIMISPSGFAINLVEHIKNHD